MIGGDGLFYLDIVNVFLTVLLIGLTIYMLITYLDLQKRLDKAKEALDKKANEDKDKKAKEEKEKEKSSKTTA